MAVRGIWGRVLRDGQPLIANDPASHPDSVGAPRGHPPLTSFPGVPMTKAGKTVGMIALANNPVGYALSDKAALEALATAFAEALYRKRAEVELGKHRQRLEQLVEQRTADLKKANIDLEARNQELDEFTYIASHDLQEPLRKLTVVSEFLAEDLETGKQDDVHQDLTVIASAADRMRTLVQDLLALSRSGRQSMKWSDVALDDCVDEALDALEVPVKESGAQIVRDRLPVVRGDQSLLTQLYQNLISNALKFRGATPPRIEVTVVKTHDGWELAVADNGIGLKPAYAEQVFLPFKRLHGRGAYEGTGIGLAICRKTIERHGGRIWVESQPGRGARFKFTLPASEKRRAV